MRERLPNMKILLCTARIYIWPIRSERVIVQSTASTTKCGKNREAGQKVDPRATSIVPCVTGRATSITARVTYRWGSEIEIQRSPPSLE